jgi:tetratricopeptide (TPR) repeat protein
MERSQRVNMLMGMLEKEPNDLFLNYALGLECAKDLQTVHDAESQFRIVLSLDETYHAAYYQLGQLFEALQRAPEAIEFYKKGLEQAEIRKDLKAANEFREAIFLLED